MQVNALACERPEQSGVPLSRYSGRELAREVVERGIVASISRYTTRSGHAVRHAAFRTTGAPARRVKYVIALPNTTTKAPASRVAPIDPG